MKYDRMTGPYYTRYASLCQDSCSHNKAKTVYNRYMAEWIESWDLEAMTSYNWEIGVRGPVGTSRLEFFQPGFTPTVFLQ